MHADLVGERSIGDALLEERPVERCSSPPFAHDLRRYAYCDRLSTLCRTDLLGDVHETFQDQLKRLRADRGFSRGVLSRRTVAPGDMGVSEQTIEALERNSRQRPHDRTVRLLGAALEASDEEFPAYALAKGRALLDEDVVGADQALANLRQLRGLVPDEPVAPRRSLLDEARVPEIRRRAEAAERAQRRSKRA